MKKFPKIFLMTFLNSVTVPKNVKEGTLCDFLTSIVLQNIETNEGGPSGAIEKTSKKSHSVTDVIHQQLKYFKTVNVFMIVHASSWIVVH